MDTVLELLALHARARGSAPAILASHQPQLVCRALCERVATYADIIRRAGIEARRNPQGAIR